MKVGLFRALLWSLSLAVVLGIPRAAVEWGNHHYLRFHLYYNALLALIESIDRLLPLTVGFMLCLLLRRQGSRFQRGKGVIMRIVLPLATAGLMIAYAWLVYQHDLRTLLDNTFAFLRNSIPPVLQRTGDLLLTPSGIFTVIAVIALVLLGLSTRKSRSKAHSPSPAVQRGRPAIRPAAVRLATGCLVLCAAAFVTLHLTAGVFWARNAITLREKPNIIFIMVDTLRADHLGCYGYDLPVTPNIDRFAQESTRFEHAVAQAPWTMWSLASLLASRFPDTVFPTAESSEYDYFSDYYPTLTEALKEQGYATHAIISNLWLVKGSGYDQGFDRYNDEPTAIKKEDGEPTSPAVTGLAIQKLKELKQRKFFLFLLYFDPHAPYHMRDGFDFGESELDRLAQEQFGDLRGEATMDVRYRLHQAYNSEIGFTDRHVGQFLDELKKQDLYDDAMIVFFSDHGEQFIEHGFFGHRLTLHREEIDIPFIVKLPRQRTGRLVKGTFPLIDLYPSLMAYLRADSSVLGLQGNAVNLATVLRCAEKPIHSATIDSQQSVLNEGYKYIRIDGPEGEKKLFDLASDPWEQRDVLDQHQQVATGMVGLLDRRDERMLVSDVINLQAIARIIKHAATTSSSAKQATLQRLRALGYLQN
jgi:arylsulfatase